MKLLGVLQHTVARVRCQDAQFDTLRVAYLVHVGRRHGTGVKGGDLIGVQIGCNKCLRHESAWHFTDMRARNVQHFKAFAIRTEIVAHCRHDQRFTAQKFQVIRDVTAGTTKFPPHIRHHKRHIEDVDLIGENMLPEFAVKNHDGVVGERTADQDGHAKNP